MKVHKAGIVGRLIPLEPDDCVVEIEGRHYLLRPDQKGLRNMPRVCGAFEDAGGPTKLFVSEEIRSIIDDPENWQRAADIWPEMFIEAAHVTHEEESTVIEFPSAKSAKQRQDSSKK